MSDLLQTSERGVEDLAFLTGEGWEDGIGVGRAMKA